MKNTRVMLLAVTIGTASLTASALYTTHQITKLQKVNQEQREQLESLGHQNIQLNDLNNNLKQQIDKLKDENINIKSRYEDVKKEIDKMLLKVSFNSEDVTQPSNVSLYHMKKALKGTPLYKEAQSFVDAERQYGVNALFLAGIVANESAWGKSNRAQTQNNLTGYAVYSRGAEGKSYDSWRESILDTAKLLSNDYLKSTGKYYNGKSAYEVNTLYCQADGQADYSWSRTVTSVANDFKDKINN